MKTILKPVYFVLIALLVSQAVTAQSTTKKSSSTHKTSNTKKPAPTSYGKEIKVTLKNLAEGTVLVFAGPKENLNDPLKRKSVGGLGTNTLYLRVNEVACIVKGEKTVSCAIIKSTTSQLEINTSGNQITAK